MRGAETRQGPMFSYIDLEQRVPVDHLLRALRALVEPVLRALSPHFATRYAASGHPSIPPEQLLRALLLLVLYTVRSERQLIEPLDFNLLFRWFVGLALDAPVWHATTFTRNRDRLLAGDVAQRFFAAVVQQAAAQRLLSHEHFTVDGTRLEAWASHTRVRPTDAPARRRAGDDDPGNPTVDIHGERRTSATPASTTAPDARFARKGPGQEAKLCHQASVLIENRHGFVLDTVVGHARGAASEVEQAIALLAGHHAEHPHTAGRRTLWADRGCALVGFVTTARAPGPPRGASPPAGRRRPPAKGPPYRSDLTDVVRFSNLLV